MPAFIHACTFCGKTYEAQRKTSKFCSDRCRQRNQRSNPNKINVEVSLSDALDALRKVRQGDVEKILNWSHLLEKVRNEVLEIDLMVNMHLDEIFGTGSGK